MKNKEFSNSFIIILLAIFLLAIIIFEAYQQLFYINRFGIGNAEDIYVVDLLERQSYRWIIWLLFSLFLWFFTKKKSLKTKFTAIDLLQYIGVILGLVLISISLISAVQVILNQDSFTSYFNDYLPYFMYQKALIFTIGYTAIAVILYQYFINKQLQIQVLKLKEFETINIGLYNKFKSRIDDSSSILNIKIGNKHKIIPIKNIRWIESDDYCVKIHTDDNISYSMRSTLKSLENKLKSNDFFRVHRNALVNMSLAKELDFSSTPKLILKDNTEIVISKSKVKSVRDYMS